MESSTPKNLELAGATVFGTNTLTGTVKWSSGVIDRYARVTIATNGALNIIGPADRTIRGVLNNEGLVRWPDASVIYFALTGTISNQTSGTFDMQNDGVLAHYNGVSTFINEGLLRKSAGTGANTINLSTFNNTGTVDVQSGTLAFWNYTQTGGKLSFGLNSLTNFGRLQFAYSVAFTGTLGVNLNGTYAPVAGDAFPLITYPSHTGGFTDFSLPSSHAWQTNNSIYGSTALTLTVLNARPTISPVADKTIDEEVSLGFTVAGSDPDAGQTVSYALLDPPGSATINTNSGAFSWAPTEAQGPSTNTISVQVTDNGTPSLSSTNTFTVIVNEVNLAPTIIVPAIQTIDELTTLTVTNFATDPDVPTNTLHFSIVSAPAGVNLNTNNGVITWTPTEIQGPGSYAIAVTVTDNNPWAVNAQHLSDTNSFAVIVREVNSAPSLIVPPTQTFDELTTLTVTNSASDPDIPANTLRFSLVSAPPGVNLNTNNGVLTWTPTETQGPGTNIITIAVTDNGVPPLSTTNSFTVIVLESNVPPVLAGIPDLTAIQGVLLLYTNSASDADLPTNTLTFDLVVFPSGMSVDAASGVLSWTPSATQVPSTNPVTVRVTDNGAPPEERREKLLRFDLPAAFPDHHESGDERCVSWPAYATGFVLQQALSLRPQVYWADMTNAVAAAGGMNRATNRYDGIERYFRLRYGTETAVLPWLTITRSNASIIVSWPLLAAHWSLTPPQTLPARAGRK